MKSFIVELWSQIFRVLGWISLFYLIRKLQAKRKHYIFVEWWVLGHLVFSIVLLLIFSVLNLREWEIVSVVYGALRVFEVFIYQINVLLFDKHRSEKAGEPYALRGYRRIVILLLHNYVEIIFWFALFYHYFYRAFDTAGANFNSPLTFLNFSFHIMTNFGYTAVIPKEPLGDILTLTQSVIGLFMVLLIIARFISLIPKPKTLDEFEK